MRDRWRIIRGVWYDDPYAKFRRAGEHLHALYDGVGTFLDEKPYRVTAQFDDDGWHRGRFHVVKEPPEALSLMLGDFIQNLRASLDHSIYALSSTKGSDRIEYPIKVQEDQYIGEPREIALEGVADEYLAVVDASQPYHRGEIKAAQKDPLAVLAWLSNVDKHRLIHPAFHRQRGSAKVTVLEGRRSDIEIRRDIPFDQPVGEGTVVSATRPRRGVKPEDVDVQTYVEFTVAFSKRALDYVALEDIWNYVSRIINTLRAVSEGRPVTLDTGWPLTRGERVVRDLREIARRPVRRRNRN